MGQYPALSVEPAALQSERLGGVVPIRRLRVSPFHERDFPSTAASPGTPGHAAQNPYDASKTPHEELPIEMPRNLESSASSKASGSFYSLSWKYAQDGKIAIDLATGIILDVNPAVEALTGYAREELLGSHLTILTPLGERERVVYELKSTTDVPQRYAGFHVRRKDAVCMPITVSTSGIRQFDGRSVVIAEFRDITDQENDQRRLSAQNWALSAFSGAALALSRARSEQELLQSMCEAITSQSAYVLAYVSVACDGPEKLVRFAAASGSAKKYVEGLRLSWADGDPDAAGPSGICIRTGQIHIMGDLETAPSFDRWRDRAKYAGIRSVAGIPLTVAGGWRGSLVVFSAECNAFDAEPVQVFQRLGAQMVHGVEALRHSELLKAEHRKLEDAQKKLTEVLAATVEALVTATEIRDPYTAGHEARVAEIAVAIGREMGWDEDRLLGMRLAAMVHDIGKIAIPAEILTKPTRLSPIEFELVKAHPETGYAILKDIPFAWPVAEIVRQHHEKLDGSGYPLGIKGNRILPESMVLTVADMVEAMGADRPYRRAHGLAFALGEVERMAGTLLDAEVVRVCASLFREGRLVVPGLS